MKVLVWAQYGSPNVYRADTPEDMLKIIDLLQKLGEEFSIPELQKDWAQVLEHAKLRKKPGAVHHVAELIGIGEHESLEVFEFTEVQ